jgi:hypothetical protein
MSIALYWAKLRMTQLYEVEWQDYNEYGIGKSVAMFLA